jgi:hypothetical protein
VSLFRSCILIIRPKSIKIFVLTISTVRRRSASTLVSQTLVNTKFKFVAEVKGEKLV